MEGEVQSAPQYLHTTSPRNNDDCDNYCQTKISIHFFYPLLSLVELLKPSSQIMQIQDVSNPG